MKTRNDPSNGTLVSSLDSVICYFSADFVHSLLILLTAGKKAYSLTWALQYINLFMINTGFIILAGSALKVREKLRNQACISLISSHPIKIALFSLVTSFSSDRTSETIFAFTVVQATYVLFRDDDMLKLPYCIAIAGLVCAMFAICIPHLSALGIWLGFSTVFTLAYIIIAFVLSLKDGNISCLLCLCMRT